MQDIGAEQEEHDSNSGSIMDGQRIISYNLNEDERPGGLKVRYKVRVVSGRNQAPISRPSLRIVLRRPAPGTI